MNGWGDFIKKRYIHYNGTSYLKFIYKTKKPLKYVKNCVKPRNTLLSKAIFRYSLRNFVKLKNMNIIYKVLESHKLLINHQKNSNIKDKIKTNVHFDNTFTVNE